MPSILQYGNELERGVSGSSSSVSSDVLSLLSISGEELNYFFYNS